MSEWSFKPIKVFRFRSIFVTSLILMIGMCTGMSLAFTAFFVDRIMDDTRDYRSELNNAYVETLIGNTEYQIRNIHYSLIQLSYSRTLSPLVVVKLFCNTCG